MPQTARKRAWERNPRYRGLRPWRKGQSGNPAGRPKGSRNKLTHEVALHEIARIVKSKRASEAVKLKASKIFVELTMKAAGLIE